MYYQLEHGTFGGESQIWTKFVNLHQKFQISLFGFQIQLLPEYYPW